MNSFYAFCVAGLFVIIALLLTIAIILSDYLKDIRRQLYKIVSNTNPIDACNNGVWSAALKIHDDTTVIKDILGKNNEDESKTDVSGDGWAIAPCPVCGGPACMHYDHDSGDGYFVICDKHKHGGCRYGVVTGGSTRKVAAFEWNKATVTYCNKQMELSMTKEDDNA